jgi:hypothetical protein
VPAACEHAKEELGSQLLAKNVSTPPIAGPLHPTNRSKTTDREDQFLQAAGFFEHAKLELRDETTAALHRQGKLDSIHATDQAPTGKRASRPATEQKKSLRGAKPFSQPARLATS